VKKLLTVLFIAFTLATGAVHAEDKPSPLTVEQATQLLHGGKPVYSCGMKPSWFSGQPGQCPCCTMNLEKVKEIKDGNAVFDTGSQSMPMMNMMEKQ
jgi:hypothetical protein